MLKLISSNGVFPLTEYKDLVIESVLEYDDRTLSFSVPIDVMPGELMHENYIQTEQDEFVIKEINAEDGWVNVKARLNIDELEGTFFEKFYTSEQTIKQAMQLALAGTGWSVTTSLTRKRTLKITNSYVWDIIKQLISTYRVEIQIDSIHKNITFVEQRGDDRGVYFTSQLNLKSVSKKSDTNSFYTRIKPVGKDGLTIEKVNSGKAYIENHQYSNKVKTYYWKDERYTVAETLMEDAAAKLNDLSKPYSSYGCEIVDLAANSDEYSILEYKIGDVVWLLDEKSKIKEKQRIVKIVEYPDAPESNTCELANAVLTFDEYVQKYEDTSETVDNITTDNGTVDGDCIDKIDSSKVVNLDVVVTNEVTAQTMNITKQLNAVSAKVGDLETNKLSATDAKITYATIENLSTTNAKIDTLEVNALTANSAVIQSLQSGVANINTLMFGSATGGTIQTEFSNSVIANLGDAQIKSAMIKELAADKITGLDLNTTKLSVHSEDGKSIWKDNTIQISDTTRVRVQIGKDASGDYNIYIWDKNGKLMFDPLYGVQEDGIKKAIIRNDMISDTANISGKKIDIASLITTINEDGSSTLKASKIYVDTDKQTLDVSFENLTGSVNSATNTASAALSKVNTVEANLKTISDKVTTQGTQLTTVQGQISSKVWQQDITTAVTSLEIGGRNLLQGTKDFSKGTRPVSGIFDLSNTVGTYKVLKAMCPSGRTLYDPFQQSITIEAKTTYTLSFYAKADSPCTIFSYFYDIGNAGSYYDGYKSTTLTTYWKHYIITWTTGDTARTASVLPMRLQATKNVWAYMYGIKFEKGNKATDWTPAPEDTDSSILGLEATTKTLSTQYTSLNQTLTSLTATVNSNTTAISKKADGSTVTTLQENFTKFKQDFNGFETTVSENYATKTEMSSKKDTLYAYFDGGGNSAGYCFLAQIKIRQTYPNTDIIIGIDQRNNGLSEVHIQFVGSNTTDPALGRIRKTGTPRWFIAKSTTSTWNLYVQKSESWDRISVTEYYNPFGSNLTVTWMCQNANAISEWTEASQMASYYGVDSSDGGTDGSNNLITSKAVYSTTTIAKQTADKFNWLVKSGTSSSDFTITDRFASLTAQYINLNGLVTFSGLNSSVQTTLNTASRSYSFTGANGSVKWVRLGTLTSAGDSSIFCINVQSGNGYNSGAYQNSSLDITIKDGWQSTQAAAASFGVSVIRHNCVDTVVVQVRASAHNVCEVWVYFPWTYWNGNYTISGRWSNWSNNITNQTAAPTTGTLQSIEYRADGQTANSKAQGIADNIYTAGTTTINGGKITTGSIAADKIKVDSLQAICAKIGGFTIDNNNIASGTWGTSGSVMMCTGTDGAKSIGGSSSISGWCFTAGSTFGVTKAGALYANNVKVSGDITATSGTIGKLVINGNYLQADSGTSGNVYRMYIQKPTSASTWCFSTQYGSTTKVGTFYARADGLVYCTSLTSNGAVSAGGNITTNGSITAVGKLTATGNLELRTSGNASNIILHDDYAKYCYIRYSGARLWFLPATDSGGFELGHSASLDANTGTFYATAWGSNSSKRYKENITELTESVADRLLKIKTYHFDYKKDYGGKDMYGVIAEEVEQVHKNAVLYRNGEPDAVDYTRFIPLLIKKVQMQDKKLKYLENVVAHLIGIAMNPEQVEVEKVRK